ncbi:MAG: hypothetical protein AAB320_01955 [Elusimicrobiota bacterium]
MTLPIWEIASRCSNEWVVLNRGLRVIDRGPELQPLRAQHGSRCTFYFVPPPAHHPEK